MSLSFTVMVRQPRLGVRLRVVAERIEMGQVVADGGERVLFVLPVSGEINFAAGRCGHALKHGV